MHKSKGFTLVELLVVIGIIALLISILLPSLARARQAALVVSDLSSLRQVGQALVMYSNDNKGFLPMGGGGFEYINQPNRVWTIVLSRYLNVEQGNAPRRQSKVMFSAAGINEPNGLSHYGWNWNNLDERASWVCHPILMPPTVGGTWMPPGNGGQPFQLRKMTSIKDPSGRLIIWSGSGTSVLNWNAYYPSAITLDNWAVNDNNGHRFTDPPANGADPNRLCGNGVGPATVSNIQAQNYDRVTNVSSSECAMRYAHNNNTTGVFLFADGHAESMKIGEVLLRHILIPR